jgi:uncharacterized membrane protein YkvA (DUF1232 family)
MDRNTMADNLRDLLNIPQMLRVFAALIRDNRVSVWLKIGVAAGALYVISPLDILPDAITGIGILDDILVGFLVLQGFIKMAPDAIVLEHCERLGISYDDIDIDLRGAMRTSATFLAPLLNLQKGNAAESARSASYSGNGYGSSQDSGAQPLRQSFPAGNPKYSAYRESQD